MTDKELTDVLRNCYRGSCRDCILNTDAECSVIMRREAADAIERLTAEVERRTRERDAAVTDMCNIVTHYPCYVCKHTQHAHVYGCDLVLDLNTDNWRCHKGERFEWRGVCAENSEEEDKPSD